MKPTLLHSVAPRSRRARSVAEEGGLHPELCVRIQRAAPFPAGYGPARKRLEEQTRESLRSLRSRKERLPANVLDRTRAAQLRRGRG
jgi:hypothetical protein